MDLRGRTKRLNSSTEQTSMAGIVPSAGDPEGDSSGSHSRSMQSTRGVGHVVTANACPGSRGEHRKNDGQLYCVPNSALLQ